MFTYTIHFKAGDKTGRLDVVAQDEDAAIAVARLGPGAEVIAMSCSGKFLAAETRKEARGYHTDWAQPAPMPPPGIFNW